MEVLRDRAALGFTYMYLFCYHVKGDIVLFGAVDGNRFRSIHGSVNFIRIGLCFSPGGKLYRQVACFHIMQPVPAIPYGKWLGLIAKLI